VIHQVSYLWNSYRWAPFYE